jgi:hypothetical protein
MKDLGPMSIGENKIDKSKTNNYLYDIDLLPVGSAFEPQTGLSKVGTGCDLSLLILNPIKQKTYSF